MIWNRVLETHGNILVCHNTHTNTLFSPPVKRVSRPVLACKLTSRECVPIHMYGLTSEMVYRLCDVALTKEKLPIRRRRRKNEGEEDEQNSLS